jgi:hypothetical protein
MDIPLCICLNKKLQNIVKPLEIQKWGQYVSQCNGYNRASYIKQAKYIERLYKRKKQVNKLYKKKYVQYRKKGKICYRCEKCNRYFSCIDKLKIHINLTLHDKL